jgi:hypothetical protein
LDALRNGIGALPSGTQVHDEMTNFYANLQNVYDQQQLPNFGYDAFGPERPQDEEIATPSESSQIEEEVPQQQPQPKPYTPKIKSPVIPKVS